MRRAEFIERPAGRQAARAEGSRSMRRSHCYGIEQAMWRAQSQPRWNCVRCRWIDRTPRWEARRVRKTTISAPARASRSGRPPDGTRFVRPFACQPRTRRCRPQHPTSIPARTRWTPSLECHQRGYTDGSPHQRGNNRLENAQHQPCGAESTTRAVTAVIRDTQRNLRGDTGGNCGDHEKQAHPQ